MYVDLFVWCTFMIIGVSDAKEHRIPNMTLLLLLGLICLRSAMYTPHEDIWLVLANKSLAFCIALLVGVSLYGIKVMAPGDAKLIAVLGFFLGTSVLINYLYYVCLVTVYVGAMYWLLNHLHMEHDAREHMVVKGQANHINFTGMAVTMQLGKQDLKKKITTGRGLTYMPFAPILIMGLALQQYYS